MMISSSCLLNMIDRMIMVKRSCSVKMWKLLVIKPLVWADGSMVMSLLECCSLTVRVVRNV